MSLEKKITKANISDKYATIQNQIFGERYRLDEKIHQKSNGYHDRIGGVVLGLIQTAYPIMDLVSFELKTVYPQTPELATAHASFVMSEYALSVLDKKGSSGYLMRNQIDFTLTGAKARDALVAEFARTLTANGKDLESLTVDYFTMIRDQALAIKEKYSGLAANDLTFNIDGTIIRGFLPVKKTSITSEGPTLDDVSGHDDVKEILRNNILIMNNVKDIFNNMNPDEKISQRIRYAYGIVPKGFLLYGPPGTGKTLLVKAALNEAGIPHVTLRVADQGSKWINETSKLIDQTIEIANRYVRENESPWAGIIIDEFDGFGKKRSTGEQTEDNKSTETLFEHMSGLKSQYGVIYFAMTNLIEALDSGLIRAGRFSTKLYVGPFDERGITDCTNYYHRKSQIYSIDGTFLKKVNLSQVIDFTISTSLLPTTSSGIILPMHMATVGAQIEDQYQRAINTTMIRRYKEGKNLEMTTEDLIRARTDQLIEHDRMLIAA